MGCPDWPKCFGRWVPPTRIDQLPENYKEVNASLREHKNQKFARYLRAIGFRQTADQISNDPGILAEQDFNPVKTWIEYLNRLVGVTIGLLIIALFWRSLRLRRDHPAIFYLSIATLVTVILQGWFGSIVVSTNLTTWTVTVHLFLAFVLVVLLLYLLQMTDTHPGYSTSKGLRGLLVICMTLLLTQVFLGTQVREAIDLLSASRAMREGWIAQLGVSFLVHRSFSLLVLFAHLALFIQLRKTTTNNPLPLALIMIILGAILTGAGMAYFEVPPVLQPVHMLLGASAFGIQVALLFRLQVRPAEPILN